jgi:hypothetical protein
MIKWAITITVVIGLGVTGFLTMTSSLVQQGIKAKIIASGSFHQVAHKGEGRATIYKLLNGERELHLTDFKTGAGRDLEVYLISAPDACENETVLQSEVMFVGALKAVEGDQWYSLPKGADLNKYRAVTIWSKRYLVNFTTAPLTAVSQEM